VEDMCYDSGDDAPRPEEEEEEEEEGRLRVD
jgi:hypothetical protein